MSNIYLSNSIQYVLLQVKKTFLEPSSWVHHDKVGHDKRFGWLPSRNEIPKNLGERPTIAHLEELDVSTLIKMSAIVGGIFKDIIHTGGWQCLSLSLLNFQMESTLRNMYTYLQKLAVGLEQVALDQVINNGYFDEEFNAAEYKLKTVSL